jgi:hypothetical protein
MFFDVVDSRDELFPAQRQGYNVLSVKTDIAIGVLRPIPRDDEPWDVFGSNSHEIYCAGGGWDLSQAFCRCISCGMIGFAFEGRSERIPCQCQAERIARGDDSHRGHNASDPLLVNAYRHALKIHPRDVYLLGQ